jgi:hypothetical protein
MPAAPPRHRTSPGSRGRTGHPTWREPNSPPRVSRTGAMEMKSRISWILHRGVSIRSTSLPVRLPRPVRCSSRHTRRRATAARGDGHGFLSGTSSRRSHWVPSRGNRGRPLDVALVYALTRSSPHLAQILRAARRPCQGIMFQRSCISGPGTRILALSSAPTESRQPYATTEAALRYRPPVNRAWRAGAGRVLDPGGARRWGEAPEPSRQSSSSRVQALIPVHV